MVYNIKYSGVIVIFKHTSTNTTSITNIKHVQVCTTPTINTRMRAPHPPQTHAGHSHNYKVAYASSHIGDIMLAYASNISPI